jgi:hypothetical protein
MTRVRNNLMALHEPHKTLFYTPIQSGRCVQVKCGKVHNVSYENLNLHGQTKGVGQKV